MAKDPLVTRSHLRKHRGQAEEKQRQVQDQAETEYRDEEKRINNYYRKQLKKNKPIDATRSSQNQRSRRMNSFLMKWIVIVFLLLVLVLMMVFFL
ncbi:cell wall synthase accessory phosphoprotein MacP [Tetragenococcus koreensis]|uniref:cell wall synthase accessory phosphoprotein MacP n=1 Tax=Tetragenococcus koreensis TaxID=290335 RepID=UPI001F2C334A|nr:cell wall synthase accessory phosphoprotein MacP [Tetragenococcus koreensis]MCF1586235.1 cell wall synthase accessory phosphoprotein MacP [Tetragenococcus koreensis]MCF1615815.1 cell wall synthase accessory phosphoprotein MacP [Tetragenococcus koreensis]MCF1620728.1 cell wall synthase accessory phosphoprotein MacP [Tetragenococcus koreensis]MCF1625601.1 cell wall synthase accessory phosphoprotein MacP [Tetragenococcus koreensis]MCF1630495.1 cell wall synthase accessory phosphoprotein MacP [